MGDGIGPANGNERATAEYSINFREHLLVLQWIKSFQFFCGQVVYDIECPSGAAGPRKSAAGCVGSVSLMATPLGRGLVSEDLRLRPVWVEEVESFEEGRLPGVPDEFRVMGLSLRCVCQGRFRG